MTITQLEYLVAVDKFKSFVDAADSCFVTQPTLSMQIQKLEEEMDILVFDRSKKPVTTTEMGTIVVEQAKIILRESERISDIIKLKKGDMSGTLRVGIIPTLSPYLTPLFVSNFIKKYPTVTLHIEELLSDQIFKALKNNLLDVGVMVPVHGDAFIKRTLFYEEFYVYLSANHKMAEKEEIDPEKLDSRDMWVLRDGHCFRSQIESICGESFDNSTFDRVRFEGGSLETLRKLVDKSNGFTMLPELAIQELTTTQSKMVKRFKGRKKPTREIALVMHKAFLKDHLIKALGEEIATVVPSHMLDKTLGNPIDWKN
jgi:LysR family hydrogen peroxide-inducible transcriptional activator